jgi:hypothetical protein
VELNQAMPEQDMIMNALNMQQKYLEEREQDDVIQMAEGGTVQTQKQEDVGAFVPPPKQNFTTLPTVQNPGATFDPNATIGDISAQMATAPQLPSGAQVQPVGVTPTAGQFIPTNIGVTGQVALPAAQAGTATTQQQTKTQAQQLQAQAVTPQVQEALQTIQGAQGQVSQGAQVQAQQQVGTSVANLTAAQGTATKMTNPVQREYQQLLTQKKQKHLLNKYRQRLHLLVTKQL